MHCELLDLKKASEFLGVKESWIRKKIFNKEIPVVKLGRLVRFRKQDLEIIIQNGLCKIAKEVK
jgi:excisionase family DNA binding protein